MCARSCEFSEIVHAVDRQAAKHLREATLIIDMRREGKKTTRKGKHSRNAGVSAHEGTHAILHNSAAPKGNVCLHSAAAPVIICRKCRKKRAQERRRRKAEQD